MTDLTTGRMALPLLALAQAQKELTHNEALALIDLLLHPVVEDQLDDPGSLSPITGQCWLVGDQPTGAWEGHPGCIAGWTEGGWRFAPPIDGMQLFDRSGDGTSIYRNANWTAPPALAVPSGGSVIDVEARESLGVLIAAMRRAGLTIVAGD
ncbi:DUF2793 domain-containing protein [Novosphingopyxis sp.]|uniref:DUF2793 domain-containing protein n=1 Tax=Novosphingopyxis sp. TaxID=2709690 RepID=UPI003B59FA59